MEKAVIRVLLIEDDEDDFLLVKDLLSRSPSSSFELNWISNYDAGIEAASRNEHDACLLDFRLGARNGLDLLREMIQAGCAAPVIFLTGQGRYELDLEAMRSGAADYLPKDQISAELLERSIRYAIERKYAENELRRHRDHLEELVRERTIQLEQTNHRLELEIAEHKRAEVERESLIVELQVALAKVKMLSGLLPICASCKKIRDDKGYWRQLETYIHEHSEVEFSHGICPECAKRLYPEFFEK
ncbi:MAG: response regulator [Syntrophobacteraceae bacterium]